uniref:Uncharacterized protein n=1 Tax=Rhizophora mucronata TaxID=61149 RepID=A0A2P2R013_RHIMU
MYDYKQDQCSLRMEPRWFIGVDK